MAAKKKKKVQIEHACSRLGKILEPEIREYIATIAPNLSVKLDAEDQDMLVGAAVNAIEDALCS